MDHHGHWSLHSIPAFWPISDQKRQLSFDQYTQHNTQQNIVSSLDELPIGAVKNWRHLIKSVCWLFCRTCLLFCVVWLGRGAGPAAVGQKTWFGFQESEVLPHRHQYTPVVHQTDASTHQCTTQTDTSAHQCIKQTPQLHQPAFICIALRALRFTLNCTAVRCNTAQSCGPSCSAGG